MTETEQAKIDAFAGQVREHQAGLRAYVRALGVDELWVDDIAQEVFVVAFRRQDAFDARGHFGRWLRGIARHLVANERRKSARHARLMHAAIVDALAAAEPPHEPRPNAELLEMMRHCVAELAPRQRELLDRRYCSGENSFQLASAMRMSAAAVRQSLGRIRVVVRACVERKLEARA